MLFYCTTGANAAPEFNTSAPAYRFFVNEGEDFVAEMDAYGSDEDSEKEQDIVFSLSGVDKGYFTVNSIKNNKGHLGHAFLRRKGNDPQFDYEGDKQTYSIIVVATDGNGDTAQKAAIVFVGDIN
eukprot:gene31859-29697_t